AAGTPEPAPRLAARRAPGRRGTLPTCSARAGLAAGAGRGQVAPPAAAMSWVTPPRLVGVAGPDGSGKSTLAAGLARRRPPGAPAAPTLYLYGCAVCRHWRGHPLHAAALAVDGQPAGLIQNWVRSFHALLDAAEMTTRLAAGVWLARAAGRRLVITDRTPLDALVKHDPCPPSLAGRWY